MIFGSCIQKVGRGAKKQAGFILLLAVAASALIGGGARRADQQMRGNLLLQARLVKQSLDVNEIRALSGTRTDIEKPEYKRLKQQLSDFRYASSKCKFLYLMGRRSADDAAKKPGEVFFYVDSERVGSEDYSPPGQVYDELAESDARVFDTRIADVTGPTSDRWGSWVSALVPITDPATGTLLAVLGMDVDASSWGMDVFARTAMPASLVLVLLIVLAAWRMSFYAVSRSTEVKPIQQRLLTPLTAVLLTLSTGTGLLLVKQQVDGLNRLALFVQQGVAADLNASVAGQAGTLEMLGAVLTKNPLLGEALKARNSVRLNELFGPLFATLKAECDLSEVGFISPDRSRLSRGHAPDSQGDLTDCFTLREAERLGRPVSGLELGGTGLFVLRSVHPVYDHGTLIGFLELGKDIQDVMRSLHVKKGVEFAVVVDKKFLEKERWEEGMKTSGRTGEWAHFSQRVLKFSTMPVLPPEVNRFVEELLPKGDHVSLETTSGGQAWRIMSVPLKDVAAAEVGNVIVLLDISEEKATQRRLSAICFGGGAVLLAGLFGFLYVLLRRTDFSIKVQQSQLQNSEQRLSATLRSIGDGVITTDDVGRVKDLNGVAERLTGWTTDAASGLPVEEVFKIVDGRTFATVKTPVEKALREGTIVELANHTVLMAKDGAQYQIADSCAPIRKPDGVIIGAVLVFRDVSAEFKGRMALQASEARHRAMFEGNPSIQLLIDGKTGDILDGNPVACSFYGYTREHIRQLKISDINRLPLENLFVLFAQIRSEQRHHFVFQHRLSDGQIRDVESYMCHVTVNGEECLYAIIHDITERKRMELELRASESRLRAITESAQDAILMMDAEGRISFWNPAAERIFGYKADEVLGRDLHTLIAPQRYIEGNRAAMPKFRETGHGNALNKTIELQALRKSGEEVAVELSLSALQIEGRWHAVGLVRDVTERKQAQEALIETNRRLTEETARANELAGQAQMASIAKSEFLANMSHEIRTPMNGVIGMTGLLLDTDLTDEQHRYAETVRSSAESLLGIINDILDFSKIEAGKMTLETLVFDLQELLDDLISTAALRAQEKGLELLYRVDTEVPSLLRGDPGRLRQILTNLVSNAIKFTQVGEVAVRVMLEAERADSVKLRFSVRDTGIGIPKNKIGSLFEKFTQADTSTTRKYGGTGLGLAICKQLSELMGGEVSVESEAGKGSEFSFTVWLTKHAEVMKDETPVSVNLRTVRVLIVDDNVTSREILTAYMTSWGMRPSQTADGPSAIQMLLQAREAGDPFQIAVLDMQMPIMDGEMLGLAITSDARLAATRMVMLTSLGIRDNAQRLQEIGFAACLTKPARHQELKRALSFALSDKNTHPLQQQPLPKHQAPRDLMSLFSGNSFRILLAEDNITNQQVALGILKKLGLRADAVANGQEALEALKTIPYDLVLMDVQMPVLDGLDATRQIRLPESGVRNPLIPVIAMTARAMQGDQEKCLAAGMNDYVSKPVTPPTLARILEKWLIKGDVGQKADKEAPVGKGRVSESQAQRPPVWDLAGMMERVMDDKNLAQAVLEGFPEDIAQRIQALKALLDAGDVAGVERQAHSINGASSLVGGEALRWEAFEMEKAARAGDLAAAAARMPELIQRFGGLKEAIEAQLKAWGI